MLRRKQLIATPSASALPQTPPRPYTPDRDPRRLKTAPAGPTDDAPRAAGATEVSGGALPHLYFMNLKMRALWALIMTAAACAMAGTAATAAANVGGGPPTPALAADASTFGESPPPAVTGDGRSVQSPTLRRTRPARY
jgi:hypothetical protein